MLETLLPVIWILIIGFCVLMYIILDGFTLGTGIVMAFMTEHERDIGMSMILPTWDGNQTWLVLGMASLYGAFPKAFSVLLPILYLPLLVMVVCLLLRGVAFEFRLKSANRKRYWDIVFCTSAIIVTFTQGVILGNVVQGFEIATQQGAYVPHDWFTPFSLFTGLSLILGYSLLGVTRLILKTTGDIQIKMTHLAWIIGGLVMVAMIIVSLWTPFIHPEVTQRWFNPKLLPYLTILPLVTIAGFVLLFTGLARHNDHLPYWASVLLFLCPYAGFAISIFPFIVPYHITLWQAASPAGSLIFILVGAVIMIPVLLIYTGYSYYIFRGKVKDALHY